MFFVVACCSCFCFHENHTNNATDDDAAAAVVALLSVEYRLLNYNFCGSYSGIRRGQAAACNASLRATFFSHSVATVGVPYMRVAVRSFLCPYIN